MGVSTLSTHISGEYLHTHNIVSRSLTEWTFRKGLYPTASFPAIIGQEVSGTIVGLPTDQSVLSDPDYTQRSFEVGHNVVAIRLGSFSEYVSVPWTSVSPVPSGVSALSATAGLLQGTTAVSFMEEAYEVKKGDVLLIHTVAGGLGLLMCQYAKSKGATVIGTTSTEEKAKLAKEHGADHVILYTKEDTVKSVLDLTKGEGVNAIFDGVGKDTYVPTTTHQLKTDASGDIDSRKTLT